MDPDQLPRPHEARLVPSTHGTRPDDRGWFITNLADASWVEAPSHGSCTELEPADEALGFEHLGFNVKVVGPGEPSTLNHREATEEDFLVLAGECLLVADGEEIAMTAWDLFHCPAGVAHTLIGAGDGPCAVLMVGRRPENAFYVADPVAARHGASPERNTADGPSAYADWPAEWPEVAFRPALLPRLVSGHHPVADHGAIDRPSGAPLRPETNGLRPEARGAFVANLTRVPWRAYEGYGAYTLAEPADPTLRSPELGLNVHVLWPGDRGGYYHREAAQEGFLVLSGECVLIVEGEERRLVAWDFFHCPAGTNHSFVGAGHGPCAIAMVGARPDEPIVYPRDDAAARHGAAAAVETDDPDVAYADRPESIERPYPDCLPVLSYEA